MKPFRSPLSGCGVIRYLPWHHQPIPATGSQLPAANSPTIHHRPINARFGNALGPGVNKIRIYMPQSVLWQRLAPVGAPVSVACTGMHFVPAATTIPLICPLNFTAHRPPNHTDKNEHACERARTFLSSRVFFLRCWLRSWMGFLWFGDENM